MAPDDLQFPLLILIVSGGHTELILMRDHLQYEKLGATLDDASGEAYDKVARLLHLGYPGGPQIEKIAVEGNPHAFRFNKPKVDDEFAFSFSGIKTAVLRAVQNYGPIGLDGSISVRVPIPDLAASFQHSVIDQLVSKTVAAAERYGATAISAQRRCLGQQDAALRDEDQSPRSRLLAAVVAVHRQRGNDRRGGAFPFCGGTTRWMGFGY